MFIDEFKVLSDGLSLQIALLLDPNG